MTDTLVNKQVITRKEHQCWGCDDGIDCGDLKDSEPEIWEEYRAKIETERNG